VVYTAILLGSVKFNTGDPPKSPLKRGTYIPPLTKYHSFFLRQVERERIQKNNPLSSSQGKSQEVANHSKYQ